MSDIPNKQPIAEVRHVHPIDPARAYKFTDQPPDPYNAANKKPQGLTLGEGRISHIEVPKGWKARYDLKVRTFEEATPNEPDNVLIYVHYIGIPIGIKNENQFSKIMLSRPRTLTPQELIWFEQLLNEQTTDHVKLTGAKVVDLIGNTVLLVRGQVNESHNQSTKFLRMYSQIDQTVHFVQEIGYQAKPELFEKFLPDAERCFKTIVWFGSENLDDFTERK